MPRELVAIAVRTPALRDYEEQPLREGEVRVRTRFGAPKHGTELHMYRGDSPFGDSRWDPEARLFRARTEPQDQFPRSLGNIAGGGVAESGRGGGGVGGGGRVCAWRARC